MKVIVQAIVVMLICVLVAVGMLVVFITTFHPNYPSPAAFTFWLSVLSVVLGTVYIWSKTP